ncbi:MAG: pyridoxamine kinase [Eubacterium sp.]|nr:pyridoxamine kinase [Eubacterium sp.]
MKKAAVINDLSGFGKCSLTASIPIISVMGVEAHPLPTAVLSNQTAYDSYKCRSLTDTIIPFAEEWKKLGAHFDAILTGFATDEEQLDKIIQAAKLLKDDYTVLVVDPVMADNGSFYDGYSMQMCQKVKSLCHIADIITPNISELFYIADMDFSEKITDVRKCADKLKNEGIKNIVVTGYKNKDTISNIVFTEKGEQIFTSKLYGGYFSGTGDILSSIVTAGAAKGIDLEESVKVATEFISLCAADTKAENPNDGVELEHFLYYLIDNFRGDIL